MADCECLPGCPFFHDQMASMPSTAELVKAQYCSGPRADSTNCARHMVFAALGRANVPSDLFPSDTQGARELLGQ
jgi:hypothetical protein